MPTIENKNLKLAVKNIESHGDTDIFPFPAENHLFHDIPDQLICVLTEVDKKFDESVSNIPLLISRNLSVVGYSGFRYGTQVDPL